MTFEEWLQHGIDQKFCTDAYCFSHGFPEMSAEEENLLEEDGEVCLSLVRLLP
jgi:hypothetical protein